MMGLYNLFSLPIYVQVFKNKFIIQACDDSDRSITVTAQTPFTTTRLLVGEFSVAESTLQKGIKLLQEQKLFKKSPIAVIQPMEMTEGGLSMVEEKLFRELSLGAGIVKVTIHVGDSLNKQQALEKIKAI